MAEFCKGVNNFLGNYRADNYADLVESMLKAYEKIWAAECH